MKSNFSFSEEVSLKSEKDRKLKFRRTRLEVGVEVVNFSIIAEGGKKRGGGTPPKYVFGHDFFPSPKH